MSTDEQIQKALSVYRAALEKEEVAKQVGKSEEALLEEWDDVNDRLDRAQKDLNTVRAELRYVAMQCQQAGISAQVLAEMAGISRQRVYQIIRLATDS